MRPARRPRALQYCHERAMRLLEEGPGFHEVAFMLKVGRCSVRRWCPALGGCLWPRVRRGVRRSRAAGVSPGGFGGALRIPLKAVGRRTFTPTPPGSPPWLHGYAKRGALERIKDGFLFERHTIRSKDKMIAWVALALV